MMSSSKLAGWEYIGYQPISYHIFQLTSDIRLIVDGGYRCDPSMKHSIEFMIC
uniref:Uncharacterized protein n=1 Tax=Picea glauca TaxID=3330 RepID=A0A117NHV4_PICGL|nr:hypothetical protein ABT39_MTgene4256 [Picea glauca]